LALDVGKVEANIARLRGRLDTLGVPLRPHVKTAKSVDVARMLGGGSPGPITVSTLAEAEAFADGGSRRAKAALSRHARLELFFFLNRSCLWG
jgi:D-serine deaminase-like pyridoxal phosphate-dependent protein